MRQGGNLTIAFIADTQLSNNQLQQYFNLGHKLLVGAAWVVHLGDGIKNCQSLLRSYPHVIYIKGNHDRPVGYEHKDQLLKIGKHKILFIHGERDQRIKEKINIWHNKLRHVFKRPPNLKNYYSWLHQKYQDKYSVVVYGHLHLPKIEQVKKSIFFCPGGFPPERLLFGGSKPSMGTISLKRQKNNIEVTMSVYEIDLTTQQIKNNIQQKFILPE